MRFGLGEVISQWDHNIRASRFGSGKGFGDTRNPTEDTIVGGWLFVSVEGTDRFLVDPDCTIAGRATEEVVGEEIGAALTGGGFGGFGHCTIEDADVFPSLDLLGFVHVAAETQGRFLADLGPRISELELISDITNLLQNLGVVF